MFVFLLIKEDFFKQKEVDKSGPQNAAIVHHSRENLEEHGRVDSRLYNLYYFFSFVDV